MFGLSGDQLVQVILSGGIPSIMVLFLFRELVKNHQAEVQNHKQDKEILHNQLDKYNEALAENNQVMQNIANTLDRVHEDLDDKAEKEEVRRVEQRLDKIEEKI